MTTPTLSDDVSKKIIDLMCISPVAVKLERSREYHFRSGKKLCTTSPSNLAPKQLDSLPTKNLVKEHDLLIFDREARAAKSQNKRFKAKNIRDKIETYGQPIRRKGCSNGYMKNINCVKAKKLLQDMGRTLHLSWWNTILKTKPNEQKRIVTTELSYYAYTHKPNKIA